MCVKVLKFFSKAIPKKTGKLIIVDAVVGQGDSNIFEEALFGLDLLMMSCSTGKERS